MNGKPLAMAMICMCEAAIFSIIDVLVGSSIFVSIDCQINTKKTTNINATPITAIPVAPAPCAKHGLHKSGPSLDHPATHRWHNLPVYPGAQDSLKEWPFIFISASGVRQPVESTKMSSPSLSFKAPRHAVRFRSNA